MNSSFNPNERGTLATPPPLHNPYQSHATTIAEDLEDYNEESFYSRHGRIGRIRFLSYSVLLWLVVMALLAVLGIISAVLIGMFGGDILPALLTIIVGVVYFFGNIIITFLPAVRRLNDLNRTGWLSLLLFVPFLNFLLWLYLIFAPGDEDSNDYGAPALPPTTMHTVLALLLPLLLIAALGIIAAVALPAYQDYVIRAQMAQIGH